MAEFLTTRNIGSTLENIIKDCNKHLFLITPYLKFSKTLYDRIKALENKGINIYIVYGKTDLNIKEEKLIAALKCNLYFKEDLHAKCYLNEDVAIITSMNLHSYSEINNTEIGIKLDRQTDKKAYEACLKEMHFIIGSAEKKQEKINHINNANTPKENYSLIDFGKAWNKLLNDKYGGNFKYSISEFGIPKINKENFPRIGVNVSNERGFITFELPYKRPILESLHNQYHGVISTKLSNYRFYWNSPYNKLCIYETKGKEFKSLNEELIYCETALTETIQFINSIKLPSNIKS